VKIKLEEYFKGCTKNPPVKENVESKLENNLPNTYINFLKFSNGIEGTVVNGSYLQLWKAEELSELNKNYQVEKFVPGMYLIGGNGGGEALGIDLRKNSPTYGYFYKIPFVPLNWSEAFVLGSDISDIKL
jgi:hypothetical protein